MTVPACGWTCVGYAKIVDSGKNYDDGSPSLTPWISYQ